MKMKTDICIILHKAKKLIISLSQKTATAST